MARLGRGRPASAYLKLRAPVRNANISENDPVSATEAGSLVVAVSSSDSIGAADSSTIAATLSSLDAIAATDGGAVTNPLSSSDAAGTAEQQSIVASMSSQDTTSGLEIGPAPPAALSTTDPVAGTEGSPARIAFTAPLDSASATENTPTVGRTDADTASGLEGTPVIVPFAGDVIHGSDTMSATEGDASPPPSTLITAESIPFLEVATVSVFDGDSVFAVDLANITPREADPVSATESGTVAVTLSSSDTAGVNDGSPQRIAFATSDILLGSDSLTGAEALNPSNTDAISSVEANLSPRVSTTLDTLNATESQSIVVTLASSDAIGDSESAASPLVQLPIGRDTVTATEGGSPPPATPRGTETVSLVETESVDRGTPTSRLFVVDVEVRVKVIEAVTRVLEIPAEVRVLVVAGGFG